MTRISERQFVQDLVGTSMDVAEASRDPALARLDLAAADLDGDGVVAGAAEQEALFAALDAHDRDGDARSLTLARPMRRTLAAIAERARSAALSDRVRPIDDRVVHLGLTPSGPVEARALGNAARVTAIESTDPLDHTAAAGGRRHDVSSTEGLHAFVAALGLPARQAGDVARALERADHGGREELARIAALWARAERGEPIPSRLVLSGHASGVGVHGEGGTVSASALGRLARAMPRAAGQIEDLHVAACYSGLAGKVRQWREVFPSLRTFWGYAAFAPSGRAAARHLLLWERGTRGTDEALSPGAARGTLRGDNVAVWTAARGYESLQPPPALDGVRTEWRLHQRTVAAYARGDREVGDPHVGELRAAYADLQTLLGHPALPPEEARALDAQRAVLFRLLFFRESVAPRFLHEHAAELREGFLALGMRVPDYGAYERRRLLAIVDEVEARVNDAEDPPAAALQLRELLSAGIRDLSPEWIPEHWVGARWEP